MKQIIQSTLLLLSFLLPATSFADYYGYDFEVDGIYYKINGNEATVSYKRADPDGFWNDYSGAIVIPTTVNYNGTTYNVNSIGNSAFAACSDLTSVTIPNSVISIGSMVFSGCTSLTSIIVDYGNPKYDSRNNCNAIIETASNRLIAGCQNTTILNSVTSIGDYAFSGFSALTSVTIPNSVTFIGDGAFRNCSSLTSVTIPNSVTYIGDYAFSYCTSLTSIDIPNSVTSIGDQAFDRTAWFNNQPEGLLYVGLVAYRFKGTMPDGTSITLENGTLGIAGGAFSGCSGLTSITIPNAVTSIGNNTFSDCIGLTSIDIPSSVTSIGSSAFRGCTSLTSVNIPNSVISISDYTFNNCIGLTNINIPNSVTSIGVQAFWDCTGLASIDIPNSVISIGDNAFSGCTGLKQLSWNAVNCNYIGNMPRSNIEQVTIGNDVQVIPNYFVSGSKITSVSIPNSVTTIGSSAFSGCNALASVTIPSSVTSIGDNAFYNCNNLSYISVENGNTIYDSRENCSALIETSSNTLLVGCKNTAIPNSVTSIGSKAFYGCSGLASVAIPNSVTSIGNDAFYGCTGLKDVYCRINNPSLVNLCPNAFYLSDSWRYAVRTLYVPKGSFAAYQSSNWFNYFGTIEEMETGEGIITSLQLDRKAAVVIEADSLQLVATVLPEDAYNKTLNWYSDNPAVATVDDNGLVMAHSVGTATITAMTTDGSNLSASCVVTVKSLSSTECLSMPCGEVLHGETITIPVRMNNEATVLAFQTDIYLPEGFTIVTDEDNEPIVEPASRLSSDHIIMTQPVSNGAVRVVCYTPMMEPISGNEGDLFYITVNVPNDAAGDYAVYLRNSRLTIDDFSEVRIPDAGAVVTVKTFIPGDVNDTHTVNVADIVTTVRYVLEMNPSPFIFDAADMNGDDEVTVTDIMLIARLILYPMMNAPRHAPALTDVNDCMSGEDISLTTGEPRTVSIALNNARDYSAFQLDLNLPEGLTASNFQLTDRAASHALEINTLTDGKVRALCYSPAIEAIDGNSGAVLTFDVTATSAVQGDIIVDGIELVTTECQGVNPATLTISVQTATAVNELTTGKAIAKVEYFNLAGQQVEKPVNGVTLIVTTYNDGTRTTTKLLH